MKVIDKKKPEIAIIGRGNVALHLSKALEEKTSVSLINPHTLEGISPETDLILIAVKDDCIGDVAEKLPETRAVVAHTAGSVPLSALGSHGSAQGVFYPLQTFTKGVDLIYSDIPVFIEASSSSAFDLLKRVAGYFSTNVIAADSEEREKLHLASVFACNFTNAMAMISNDILANTNIPLSVMQPLMRQTIHKLRNMTPKEAQTGPAARNDKKTMNRHLKLLENSSSLQQIYSLLSNYISENVNADSK